MAPDVPNTESAPEIASGDAGATPAHPAYGVLREVTPFASVLLCNNPGAFELDGTNTWILRAPDSETSVVVDPGPAKHGKHVRAVAKAAGEVELVLISHRHHDHVGACKKMRKLTGAPQRAYTDKYSDNAPRLRDREVIKAAGLTITVMHTPGHTADSVSFLVEWEGQRALLSGDTILGFGTTVLDPTDGTLTDYFNSINRVIVDASDAALLPAQYLDSLEDGRYTAAAVVCFLNLVGVENGKTVYSAADLSGRRIVMPNTLMGTPEERMLDALLSSAGVPADINYADDEAVSRMAQDRDFDVMMLPADKYAEVFPQGGQLIHTFNLAHQWSVLLGRPPAGFCLAVRNETMEQRPEDVSDMLSKIKAAVNFLNAKHKKAAVLASASGLGADIDYIRRTIPHCMFEYLDGDAGAEALEQLRSLLTAP